MMFMKLRFLLLLSILLFGCLGEPPQSLPNIVNGSEPGLSKYVGFVSFEFPSSLNIEHKTQDYDSGRGFDVKFVMGLDIYSVGAAFPSS